MIKWFDFALSPALDGTESLYVRKADNGFSFDTYFNSVPIAKLIKYTNVKRLVFQIDADGQFKAEICVYNGTDESVLTQSDFAEISVDTECVPTDSKLLYLKIKDCANVKNVSVFAECSSFRKVSAAAVMCTYKREEYAVLNANLLAGIGSPLLSEIILVDNGRTISSDSLDCKVRLVPNINNGGSGGYSKGMTEAVKNSGCTHIILVDDDVRIEPLSIHKMLGFLQFVKEEYSDLSVSGSMLYIDNYLRQFEAGGKFEKDGTQKGYGHYLDLSLRESLAENEADNDINYGGWWFMCMPSDYAKSGQLPMPFFIKYDDVEYALRCKLRIITLNGAGIWHEPFEWKYNSSSEYYNTRNYLHLCSMYCDKFTRKKAKKIARAFMNEKLCRQQYKMAEAVRLGYKDYLKGIKYLCSMNAEDNHFNICKLNYKMLSENELIEQFHVKFSEDKYLKSKSVKHKWYMTLFFYGLLIPASLCKKDYAVVDTFFDKKEMYWMYKRVLHFNQSSKKGYVTRLRKKDYF